MIEEIVRKEFLPMKITSFAKEKGNMISEEVANLCMSHNLPTYEVFFYMISESEEAKKPSPIISDMYIAHDQDVSAVMCKAPGIGAAKSKRDIMKDKNMRITGFGHSHGDMNVFFSGQDEFTFEVFTKDLGMYHIITEKRVEKKVLPITKYEGRNALCMPEGKIFLSSLFDLFDYDMLSSTKLETIEEYEQEIRYSYALVFNARGDEPHSAIGYNRKNEHHLIEYVPVKVISTSQRPNRKNIRRDIVQRVLQIKEEYEKKEEIKQNARSRLEQSYERFKVNMDQIELSKKGKDTLSNAYKSLQEFEKSYSSCLAIGEREITREALGNVSHLIWEKEIPLRILGKSDDTLLKRIKRSTEGIRGYERRVI